MARGLDTSRMRIHLEFGKEEPTGKTNPNTGKAIQDFQPHFKRWAGVWTLTQTQAVNLAGEDIRDARVFFIRHTDKVTSDLLVRYKGIVYSIQSIAYDDGLSPDGFDLITCKRYVVNHG